MNTDTHPRPTEAMPATSDALVEEAMAWFARLRGESVSAEDRLRFDAWLKRSPAHQRTYEEVAAFWDNPDFAQVLGEAAAASTLGQRRAALRSRRQAKPALALAAGLALFAVLYRSAGLDCLQADHCTAVGEVKTLALDDGSHITLDTDSAISVAMGSGSRHVRLLRGEAFFEVSPDAQRPFLVDGRHSHTWVTGTRFIVCEGKTSDTVSVLGGVVEVSRDGQNPALLREGEQITVDADRVGDIRKVSASAAAWMKGKILFDNAPLAEVVTEIARYRRGAVFIKGDGLKSLRVSGRFDITDIDKALESLAQTLRIRVYRITPWLVVIA